jgi:hypothetical protein
MDVILSVQQQESSMSHHFLVSAALSSWLLLGYRALEINMECFGNLTLPFRETQGALTEQFNDSFVYAWKQWRASQQSSCQQQLNFLFHSASEIERGY